MTYKQRLILTFVIFLTFCWEFQKLNHLGFIDQDNNWLNTYTNISLAPPFFGSRPLMAWSWWLQTRYTPTPLAFHLVNLGLHVIASFLVACLAFKITKGEVGAWVAGSLFLLNPIQIETAAYLSARTELFAAIGILSTCLLLSDKLTIPKVFLAGITGLFAFAGKESAIVLIAFIPILRKQWFLSLFALILLAILTFAVATNRFYNMPGPVFWSWVLIQSTAAWRLIGTAITLVGNTVDFDYDSVPLFMQSLSVMLLCITFLFGWLIRKEYPIVSIGIFLVMAVIIPRLCVMTPRSNFNEHQYYSGMIGMSLIPASLGGGKYEK